LTRKHSHLVGLIIGRPSEPLVRDQIIPNLEYWHHRSAAYVDLFCFGFYPNKDFAARDFERALISLESNTRWTYGGGTELLLFNVNYSLEKWTVEPDFSTALALTLESVVNVDGYERLPIFFEKILTAAKLADRGGEAADISNSFGRELTKSALIGLLVALVPESMKKEARDAFIFAVKDISKRNE